MNLNPNFKFSCKDKDESESCSGNCMFYLAVPVVLALVALATRIVMIALGK